MLDLAGYTDDRDLAIMLAVEPSAGEGAFLSVMIERLVRSCRNRSRPLSEAKKALLAFELDIRSAAAARDSAVQVLLELEVDEATSVALAETWIRAGDYLREAGCREDLFQEGLPQADFVIGNPPYVRVEDVPANVSGLYRALYPTMMGRADLYIAFYEAALRQLKPDGVCAFICADRWMLNQYGAELRRLITTEYAVDVILEMHEANAFHDEVSAYPAVTIVRKAPQGSVIVARAEQSVERHNTSAITSALISRTEGTPLPGLTVATVATWFRGADPWPCSSPKRLELLRKIEDRFPPLETRDGATKVGIGVATGSDAIFITQDGSLVEASRLLPLALAEDTTSGHLQWSGHYLVNPWNEDGLVDLDEYPRLKDYFKRRQSDLKVRHTAQRTKSGWYKTIDRVNHSLTSRPKLYIADIQDELNPVLDRGVTYPHHNLYYVQSEIWDLEILGGILLSRVAQLFIEAYGVRMRGGYLRFQAQYLRRIRVPRPEQISPAQERSLRRAFELRDRQLATDTVLSLFNLQPDDLTILE